MIDFNKLNTNQKKEIYKIFFKNKFYGDLIPKFIYTSFNLIFFETNAGELEAKISEVENFYDNNLNIIRKEKLNRLQNL